ncbi:hypothetical protein AVEN_39472-1 [Araneus ventricosus]|uniref:Uncharacterized protein n=1 Tax=Araneus ventricosus TaxID=182803 RepID=A0A4Y2D858_ARAVE|nr:hypothetical protein AVEN_39472-1 [Araneus ventricosus]
MAHPAGRKGGDVTACSSKLDDDMRNYVCHVTVKPSELAPLCNFRNSQIPLFEEVLKFTKFFYMKSQTNHKLNKLNSLISNLFKPYVDSLRRTD